MDLGTREVQGFRCLNCFGNIFVDYAPYTQWTPHLSKDSVKRRNDECKCGNCALILDDDGIQHLYVDDISTVMQVVLEIEDYKILRFNIKALVQSFYFWDYKGIRDTGWSFRDGVNQLKSSKVRQAFKKKVNKTLKSQLKQKD